MAKDKKDATTVLDVIKSHFGIDRMAESRAERRSALAQEQREKRRVNSGSASFVETDLPPIQIVTEPVSNEKAYDNKCPACGGTLAFNPATGKLSCSFCGREEFFRTEAAEPEKGYSLYELQNNIGRRLHSVDKVIVCGSCGGNFQAVSSAITSLCPYCGSNSITVAGNSSDTLEPTGIIPFKIGKDEAQDIFKQWIKGRRFSPTDIVKDSQITDLTGVYVPYWVFDCDTITPYEGKFGKYGSGEDSYTEYHLNSSVCEMPVRNLTFVASSRLEKDSFWKVVSYFDMSATQKYDTNLLAGFWSESYTVDGPSTWRKACVKLTDMIRRQIKANENADVIAKLDMKPQAANLRAKYVLAPIWITSFDYHGKKYRVLINGQTGDIVGTWPKSYKKLVPVFIIIGAIVIMEIILALVIYTNPNVYH